LLGIGDVPSITRGIECGIDTFDSAYPTKCARHGMLLSDNGPIKIGHARWKHYHKPISQAPLVVGYNAAYLHHLFKAREMVGQQLAAIHNVWYMASYMEKMRNRILNDEL